MERSIQKHNAFTVIELLIIVILFVTLSALLAVIFAKPGKKNTQIAKTCHVIQIIPVHEPRSDSAICSSNLKQISMALMQYAQDYDERLPYLSWGIASQNKSWAKTTLPYTKNLQIWRCPSADINLGASNNWSGDTEIDPVCDYAWNEDISANTQKLSDCSYHSTTYLLMDKGNSMSFSYWLDWPGRAMQSWTFWRSKPGPHNSGKMIAFVDGHVRWLTRAGITAMDLNDRKAGNGYDAKSIYHARMKN